MTLCARLLRGVNVLARSATGIWSVEGATLPTREALQSYSWFNGKRNRYISPATSC
ncbi:MULTISPECIES: hypothetical protein [unclassified Microcoleus]|uniref:hypothetical protein n=1 Tax=unclassified Microcoleus TaxID=2642155 RepID=UPI0025FA0973|nr:MULTISPECIES: hypothetical protein [unclassified Microcoleus]